MQRRGGEVISIFDKAFLQCKEFILKYKYELIATSLFVSLICGLLFAQFSRSQATSLESPIVIEEPTPIVESIVVDIAGAVSAPGVFTMQKGSRVVDLIAVAGGFTDDVDRTWVNASLNQASILQDGQKVYIPLLDDPFTDSTFHPNESHVQGVQNNLTSINSASQSELEDLPGIGPAFAKRIIDNRPFSSIDELQNVSGIGKKTYEQIKDLVTL